MYIMKKRMEKAEAQRTLHSLIERITVLKDAPKNSPDFQKWKRDVEVAISHVFSGDVEHMKDFTEV